VKRRRFPVPLLPSERATIGSRAAAHKTSVAGFMRAAALGVRPGADPGTDTADADDWWDSLPPARRAQIRRWVSTSRRPTAFPGQDLLPLIEETP
jgi:hypothetical protein